LQKKNSREQYIHHVRLLVSASPNQPANSVFFSQQTSTSQPKSAQKPTSEQFHRKVMLFKFDLDLKHSSQINTPTPDGTLTIL